LGQLDIESSIEEMLVHGDVASKGERSPVFIGIRRHEINSFLKSNLEGRIRRNGIPEQVLHSTDRQSVL
jgi:hypothetical protein